MPQRSSQEIVSSDPDGGGPKRRRIALACNACRTRKSRCDGQRPTCSACSQLNFDCQYDAPDSATNVIVRKEYVSDLEQRLKDVESLLQRHDDLLTGHLSACTPKTSSQRDSHRGDHPSVSLPYRQGEEIELDADGLEDSGGERDDEPGTDGLAITFVDENASVYFGESSNIQFVRYLLRAISTIWQIKMPERPTSSSSDTFNENQLVQVPGEYSPLGMDTTRFTGSSVSKLPPASEMEDLMRVYFRSMGLLFPFLHEPTFWEVYRQFKSSGFLKVRRTWLGLLNMILAMASNIDRGGGLPANERMERSLEFYTRGVELCSASSVRTVSLDVVHYLLLQVLFLQGTPRSIQAWTIHGMLVRTATALGLHCDHAGRHLPAIEQESRRRTWHTIYCVDKVMSATFGRPSAIFEDQCAVPLPRIWPPTEKGISTRRRRDDEGLMQFTADFLAISTRLYQIMGQCLSRQYNGNIGSEDEEPNEIATIQAFGEMRQMLRQWMSSIPENLEVIPSGSPLFLEKSLQNKLRTTLTIRYHNVNILIHRPLLCATLRYLSSNEIPPDAKLPYTTQLAMSEADECVSSAERTIEIVSSILADNVTGGNNLGVWFFTLYYVFTAALMVCARLLWAQHGKTQDVDSDIERGRSYLAMAAEALDKVDQGNRLINQCSRYIRYLSKLQDGRFSGGNARAQQSDSLGEVVQMGDMFSADDMLSATDFTQLNDFLNSSGDFGPYFTGDMFNPNLLGGFMPSR